MMAELEKAKEENKSLKAKLQEIQGTIPDTSDIDKQIKEALQKKENLEHQLDSAKQDVIINQPYFVLNIYDN